MMNTNRKSLEEREIEFAEKVNKLGKFEYIGGYYNIKGNVKVKHKKCGCETMMRAYAVAYSDIDSCHECGRQKREYNKCKKYIERLNNVEVLCREMDSSGRNRYFVRCNECGDTFDIAYEKLRDGSFKCCIDGVGAYERGCKDKADKLYKKIKEDLPKMSEVQLKRLVYAYIEKDNNLLVAKGLHDKDRLVEAVIKHLKNRLDKAKLAKCLCCGEVKSGLGGWGRREANYKSKICVECAKKDKVCPICNKSKKLNTYALNDDGTYQDICQMCYTKSKSKK